MRVLAVSHEQPLGAGGLPGITANRAWQSVPWSAAAVAQERVPVPVSTSDCCEGTALHGWRWLAREARRAGVQPPGWRAARCASVGFAGWAFGLRWNVWFSRHRFTGTSAKCSTSTGSNWAAVP